MSKPLRVLEIGGIAAAYCGRLFCRTGADVVRVNRPGLQGWVGEAAMNAYLNTGKRVVPDSQVVSELAGVADVVIQEAATADALEPLGTESSTRVTITPFGATGPECNRPATPATLLALGGHTIIAGDEDDAPLTLPGHYLEFQSGTLAYFAARAAAVSGAPQSIDISMLEVAMSLTQFSFLRWQCLGEERTRHGNEHYYLVPMNAYPCVDGWVYVNVVPNFWDAFCVFIDRPELLLDDRLTTNTGRMEHRDLINRAAKEALAPLTRAEAMQRAEAARLPVGSVMTFAEVLEDPHLAARDRWERVAPGVLAPKVPFCDDPGPWAALQAETPAW